MVVLDFPYLKPFMQKLPNTGFPVWNSSAYLLKTFPYSSRNAFQSFHTGSKYKPMSSIERWSSIFHNSNHWCKNRQKLLTYLLKSFHIGLRTRSNSSRPVPNTTRWALSTGDIVFYITQTIRAKIIKYWLLTTRIVAPTYENLSIFVQKCVPTVSIESQVQLDELYRLLHTDSPELMLLV